MNFRFLYLLIPLILYSYFIDIDSIFHSQKNNECQYNRIDEPCQFSALLDEKPFLITDNVDGIKSGSNSFKNLKKLPDSSRVVYQTYFYKTKGGDVVIEVNYGTLKFPGMKPSMNDFENFFNIGMIKYSVLAFDGIEIKYRDKKGNLWSTNYGLQAGSNFEFSEFQKDSNLVKFKAVFNCMLYNSDHDLKTLSNGVFIGYFQNN
jgi:hypothetical protein